jgi:hypothetical protein
MKMRKQDKSDSLFREYPNMPSDYTRMMYEKDNIKLMQEQYRMLQLQRKEYKKNTWLLVRHCPKFCVNGNRIQL